MANNIQLYTIGPLEFPSLDINSVEGKWAADCVAHERQQIKRNRLMQDMLETGTLTTVHSGCQNNCPLPNGDMSTSATGNEGTLRRVVWPVQN